MLVCLEMTSKDVTLFPSMYYITDYQYHFSANCANRYSLNNYILCECHIDVRYRLRLSNFIASSKWSLVTTETGSSSSSSSILAPSAASSFSFYSRAACPANICFYAFADRQLGRTLIDRSPSGQPRETMRIPFQEVEVDIGRHRRLTKHGV
jgi:hypothetical protein